MGKVDRLSTKLDQKVRTENDNNNQILIKKQWIHSLVEVVIEGSKVDVVEKIKARDKNKEVVRVVEEIKKAGVKELREEEWQIEENLMLKERKVYIPKNKALRVEIIQLHYDVSVTKHRGRQKIMELVTRNYWWPGVTRDVRRYMNGYDMYQRIKNRIEVPARNLKLSEIPDKP